MTATPSDRFDDKALVKGTMLRAHLSWATNRFGPGWEPARLRLADAAAEGKAQVGHVLPIAALHARQVHADQRTRLERSGRFLQGLAHHALLRRFARLQVAGRVVQPQAVGCVLLDQQVAAVALDDGGHGDGGAETFGGHHARC